MSRDLGSLPSSVQIVATRNLTNSAQYMSVSVIIRGGHSALLFASTLLVSISVLRVRQHIHMQYELSPQSNTGFEQLVHEEVFENHGRAPSHKFSLA